MIHIHGLPPACVQKVHFPLGVSLQHTKSVYVIYYHSFAYCTTCSGVALAGGNVTDCLWAHSSVRSTGVTKMPSLGPSVKKLCSCRPASSSCPGDSLNVNLHKQTHTWSTHNHNRCPSHIQKPFLARWHCRLPCTTPSPYNRKSRWSDKTSILAACMPRKSRELAPLVEAGQSDLGFLQGKALAHADAGALPKCHPAAGNLFVECGLLGTSLYPALGNELLRLSIVLLTPLQREDGHLHNSKQPKSAICLARVQQLFIMALKGHSPSWCVQVRQQWTRRLVQP